MVWRFLTELDKEGLKALDEAVKALTEKKEQAENNTDAKMSGEDGQAEQKGSAESESNEAKAVSETAATVDTAEATASSENPGQTQPTPRICKFQNFHIQMTI